MTYILVIAAGNGSRHLESREKSSVIVGVWTKMRLEVREMGMR